MTKSTKVPASDEAWESGQLGRDAEFAEVVKTDEASEQKFDESLGLQLISIRLPKSLIEDFKIIAKLNGIGYQPLMRQTLKRFAEGEKRTIMRELACEMERRKKEATKSEAVEAPIVERKQRVA
jgi:predicted DNA binding CopG/RHH family protein